jgi:hypothetical protein
MKIPAAKLGYLLLFLACAAPALWAKANLEVSFSREKLVPYFDVLKSNQPSASALTKQKADFQEATGLAPEEVKAFNQAFLLIDRKRINITPILQAVAKFQSLPSQIIEARIQDSFDPTLQNLGFLLRLRLLQNSQMQPVSEVLVLFSHQGKPLALGANLSQIILNMEPYVYLNNFFVWEAGQFKGMRDRVEILVFKNGTLINRLRPQYEPLRLQEGVAVAPFLSFEKVVDLPYALIAGGILHETQFTPITPPLGNAFSQYAVVTPNNLIFRSAASEDSQKPWYKFLSLKTGRVFSPESELLAQGYEINAPLTYENESFLSSGSVSYFVRRPRPEDWQNAESRSTAELKKAFTPELKKYFKGDGFQILKVALLDEKNKLPDLEIRYTVNAAGIQKTLHPIGTTVDGGQSLFYELLVSRRTGFLNSKNQMLYIKENHAPTYGVEILEKLEP